MLQMLTKRLDLTADEQAKIKPILDTEQTDMQANRQNTALSQEDRRAKNKEIRDAANTQINAVLTPDQQTKFAAMQQEMQNRRHGGAGGGSSPAAAASPAAQ